MKKVLIYISLFVTLFNANLYAETIRQKLDTAENLISKGNVSGAVLIYSKLARNRGINNKIRANAMHRAAVIRETRLKKYESALGMYKKLLGEFPGYRNTMEVRRRKEHVEKEIEKYRKPLSVFKMKRYVGKLKPEEIKSDIKSLKSMISQYPDFYKIPEIYAMLGGRYFMLGRWLVSYRYCRRADRLNPDLRENSMFSKDIKQAHFTFKKNMPRWIASIFIFICIVWSVRMRFWRGVDLAGLKLFLLLLISWFILAVVIFSLPLLNHISGAFPLLRGIEVPDNLKTPIFVLPWYRPFDDSKFWYFILYSIIAMVLVWLGASGFAGIRNWKKYPAILVHSIIITTSIITIFLCNFYMEGFYYRKFMFFEEDSSSASEQYPHIFKKYTTREPSEIE